MEFDKVHTHALLAVDNMTVFVQEGRDERGNHIEVSLRVVGLFEELLIAQQQFKHLNEGRTT